MKKITLVALLAILANICHSQKLPYPIIFVHGLNSDSNVWYDSWDNSSEDYKIGDFLIESQLDYGGRIDFCLNDDGNNSATNVKLYPMEGADIAIYTNYATELDAGDFYLVNFNIDNQGVLGGLAGFTDLLSNQSAIVKQGVALKYAIAMVLDKTGTDKVILMGHSMGGLACREYLQNESNWQFDGEHHIAKIITTGTPHGGYGGLAISNPLDPIDSQSEAYRDLRDSYFISGEDGVYLFGGQENGTIMNNNLLYSFYNFDVNCNGILNESIIGLNQKELYDNVDYSYIIGICNGCNVSFEGDGVVRTENADWSNFYDLPYPKNEFIYTADATIEIHTDLPKQIFQNMQGLDEPNEYSLSYGVYNDIEYKGFITAQPENGYDYDYDDYTFVLNNDSNINLNVNNTFAGNLNIRLLDAEYNPIGNTVFINDTDITLSYSLPAGQYYLELFAIPTDDSHMFPYTFSLTNNLSTEEVTANNFKVYPNPTDSKIFIDSNEEFETFQVFNMLGQEVLSGDLSGRYEINLVSLVSGTYVVKVSSTINNKTFKVLKQ